MYDVYNTISTLSVQYWISRLWTLMKIVSFSRYANDKEKGWQFAYYGSIWDFANVARDSYYIGRL